LKPSVSIIIPSLNEDALIDNLLNQLQLIRSGYVEIVVCDGGSIDNTSSKAKKLCDRFLVGQQGRAAQMNLGAQNSENDWLWFLHVDSTLLETPNNFIETLTTNNMSWGFFQIRLNNPKWYFRIIEWFINKRSIVSKIGTGDQGIFIHRQLFDKIGGYADISLMEDVEICKRLKTIQPPIIPNKIIQTSARRWEQKGILQTIFLMWALRLGFFLNISPEKLAKFYK
tara:strand:+ start:62965 stop:63642 length:678 start_codon:yes stop_codon:yes gene_type:complete